MEDFRKIGLQIRQKRILNWQYLNNFVVDSVARSGSHSFAMEDIENIDYPYFYTSLIYRLSQVNNNVNKDRIKPGTELTVSGIYNDSIF